MNYYNYAWATETIDLARDMHRKERAVYEQG